MAQNLELGGGNSPKIGYLNMDAFARSNVDLVHDATKPWPLDSKSIDNISSCEFLEHINQEDIEKVLSEAHRVLKIGGRFSFSCPDFEKIVVMYREVDEEELVYLKRSILGDGTMEFDYHRNVIWFDYIKKLMEGVGFKNIVRLECGCGFKQSTKLNVEGFKL